MISSAKRRAATDAEGTAKKERMALLFRQGAAAAEPHKGTLADEATVITATTPGRSTDFRVEATQEGSSGKAVEPAAAAQGDNAANCGRALSRHASTASSMVEAFSDTEPSTVVASTYTLGNDGSATKGDQRDFIDHAIALEVLAEKHTCTFVFFWQTRQEKKAKVPENAKVPGKVPRHFVVDQ